MPEEKELRFRVPVPFHAWLVKQAELNGRPLNMHVFQMLKAQKEAAKGLTIRKGDRL